MTAISQRSRPRSFSDVIGQEHVTGMLRTAVDQDRLGHAYLFSGPRGVGKTTSARLLAMAVNCSAGAERPCGRCEDCLLVTAGSHPDVIELDAASNNSVDDIRDLREKTGLASMRGGSRVWILDEAHMLSRAAANALLKTLEEPPPKLMFILATTEPEKLPPTVLSRCQHYRFRRLADEEILQKLERLVTGAGVTAEDGALSLIARSADGAMRDAESLLERLLVPDSTITVQAVTDALGLPPAERLEELARSVAAVDTGAALSNAAGLYHDGFAPRSLAERLTVTLRDALVNALTEQSGFRLELATDRLMRVIATLDEEQERFVRRDDLFSLEVALIKAINSLAEPVSSQAAAEATAVRDTQPGQVPDFDPLARPARAAAPERSAPRPARQQAAAKDSSPGGRRFSFHTLREEAGGKMRAFLMPAQDSLDGTVLTLDYPEQARFHYGQLLKHQDELEQLLARVAGPEYTVVIRGPGGSGPKKA